MSKPYMTKPAKFSLDFKATVILMLSVLLVMLFIGTVQVWKKGEAEKLRILNTVTFVKEMYIEDMFIPENQKAMKYLALYARYVTLFSRKYKKYSMNKWQMADWVRLAYRFEKRLGLPVFYFVPNVIMESDINPNLKGPCKELGVHQQHPSVMGLVWNSLRILKGVNSKLAKELDPKILHHGELRGNPIASLKCQALIAWDCKKFFDDNAIWWVSDAHWGGAPRASLRYCYIKDEETPMAYVWKSRDKNDKVKIDSRNPLKYYIHWQSIRDKLMTGRVDIWREVKYEVKKYRNYLKLCAEDERKYIQDRRWINISVARMARQDLLYRKAMKELRIYRNHRDKTIIILMKTDRKAKQIYSREISKYKNYKKAYSLTEKLRNKTIRKLKKIYDSTKGK